LAAQVQCCDNKHQDAIDQNEGDFILFVFSVMQIIEKEARSNADKLYNEKE
jgi:hypothetical protein